MTAGGEGAARVACAHASEAILIAIAVLAPWAYGGVDAWAELALEGAGVTLAVLSLVAVPDPERPRVWLCSPSVALGGLAMLAFLQSTPLPATAARVLAPSVQKLRRQLAPDLPQGVMGDAGDPVAPPETTIALEPEAARHAAMILASSWMIFRAALGLKTAGSTRRFAMAMTINAALLTVFAGAQAMTWDGRIYGLRRTEIGQGGYSGGPFVCHNHLAACLNLGLGCALGRLLARSRRDRGVRGRILPWAFAAGLIVAGVLASHSRGGFLAMIAAAVVTLVASRAGAWKGLVAMAVMAALFLAMIGGGSVFDRVGSIWDAGASGFNGRWEVWGVAIRTWWEHPLMGTGLGGFAWAASPGFEHDRGVYFSHAENEPLQMLVEGGLVGLDLLLIGVAGVARLGWKALRGAANGRDRATILGGLAALLAFAVQSLGDFAARIPGVSIAALILAAHLCRMGLEAEGEDGPTPGWGRKAPRLMNGIAAFATALVALLVCRHGIERSRAESAVTAAGLPPPGASLPDFALGRLDREELERMRDGLERAIRHRPDWCEGHLRLGVTLMALYETTVRDSLAEALGDEERAAALADPLRLHAAVHASGLEGAAASESALAHDPVGRYLVPAARGFLQARRCCPVAAASHAGLGALDFLVERGEPAGVHASRALRLSGFSGSLAARAGRIAGQSGRLDLAAECWRRAFRVGLPESEWAEVARAACATLPAETILQRVCTSGRDTLRLACLVFGDPEDAEVRDGFLKAALVRLPDDTIPESERSFAEGQALAWLDRRDEARAKMKAALEAEASRGRWRGEYVDWLIGWGDVREAHRQAVIGVALDPHGPAPCSTLRRAISALAMTTTENSGPPIE